MSIFETYYVCRCIEFCQTSFHSIYNTFKFNAAEKSDNTNKVAVKRVTYLYPVNGHIVEYKDYPATIILMYTIYGVFALTSMAAVETTMKDFNLPPTSPINSVEQITSLVIAIATIIRAAWLFLMFFIKESRAHKHEFMWPLKFEIARSFSFK
jgi:hypothetical protein